MWLGPLISCSPFLVSSLWLVLEERKPIYCNFQNLVLTAKPVYSKCFGNIRRPKEIKFTAQITCVFPSIIDWLTYISIFTDTTENSFQAFSYGKHAKILVISQSISPHQLQGVIKHLENAACHSEQISKISQSFFTFIDMKALLHIENLAFVTVF